MAAKQPSRTLADTVDFRRGVKMREERDLFQRLWSLWGGVDPGAQDVWPVLSRTLAIAAEGPDVGVSTSKSSPCGERPPLRDDTVSERSTWQAWTQKVAEALPSTQAALIGLSEGIVSNRDDVMPLRAALLARAGTYRGTWQRLLRHDLGVSYRIHVRESTRRSTDGTVIWTGLHAATLSTEDVPRVQARLGVAGLEVPSAALEPSPRELDEALGLVRARSAMDHFSAMAEIEALTREARPILYQIAPDMNPRPSSASSEARTSVVLPQRNQT